MLVESTIQPTDMCIDKVEGGRVRLLCRWNITQITRTDEFGEQSVWQYEEAALWWTFPYVDGETVLDNVESIGAYLSNSKDEILNYAKGTRISIKGDSIRTADIKEVQLINDTTDISSIDKSGIETGLSTGQDLLKSV